MYVLPSEKGLDLRSLPVQASAKSLAKLLDFGLVKPSLLSEVQSEFSWRTGGSPASWLAGIMMAWVLSMPMVENAKESST